MNLRFTHMTDPKHIPHLIQLLDDESDSVRTKVMHELSSFGPILQSELKRLSPSLNPAQKQHLHQILKGHKRIWLKRVWPGWYSLGTDHEKLEAALSILSEFLSFPSDPEHIEYVWKRKNNLKTFLDSLAFAYSQKFKNKNARLLAEFLFKKKGLCGNEDDYYNPQNSNLIHVMKAKKGIPISLASIYMLVGARLGLSIEGCHFPGHFLARISMNGRKVFVDCFNAGQIIEEKDIARIRDGVLDNIEHILREKVDAESMIRRYLANLVRAFQLQENDEDSELMISLFKGLDERLNDRSAAEISPEKIISVQELVFQPGEVVQHRRYGYRGIIVDCDQDCQATDSWYYGNQSQPKREQPWYHVLVHGSDQVTYVAESNLVEDASAEKIVHPLLSYFFTKKEDGGYVRNDNPWPDTDF